MGAGQRQSVDYPNHTPLAPFKGGVWRVKTRPAPPHNEHYVRLSLIERAKDEKPQQKKRKKSSCREIEAESDSWNTVSLFGYLGVSKLSCRACSIWIQVLNKQGGYWFYTRGTHGNWYWPSGLPTLKDSFTISMVKEIRKSYRLHCRAQGRLKTLSDGSTTDTDSTRFFNPIAESLCTSKFSMPPG